MSTSATRAEHVVALFVTDEYRGGWWDGQGYNWFSDS